MLPLRRLAIALRLELKFPTIFRGALSFQPRPLVIGTLRDESIAQIAGKIAALQRGEAIAGIVDPACGY